MNPVSARTLVMAAVIVGFLGLIVLDPSARFFMLVFAAIVAAIPALAGKGTTMRLVALAVSVAMGAGAAAFYSEHEEFRAKYLQRAQERAAKAKAPQPPPAAPKQ